MRYGEKDLTIATHREMAGCKRKTEASSGAVALFGGVTRERRERRGRGG
jgi:hypothetical protein